MNSSGKFIKIKKQDIESTLKDETRQYLVGSLGLPQLLKHIDEQDLEIGITDYKEKTIEKPHWHSIQKEYQYVLKGQTKYIDIATKEEFFYSEGDFYAIYPEICYKQISEKDTRILFIKTPSVNDKVVCERCIKVECDYRDKSYINDIH